LSQRGRKGTKAGRAVWQLGLNIMSSLSFITTREEGDRPEKLISDFSDVSAELIGSWFFP